MKAIGRDESGDQRWEYLSGPAATPDRFSDGLRLSDINGDGLMDVVDVRGFGVTYWLNKGNGACRANRITIACGRAAMNPICPRH